MFLAVEIFVVTVSECLYLFMCVLQSLVWMCVNVYVLCVLASFFFFFSFFFFLLGTGKKKKNLVKTFCKNGNVNTVLCYMLFFHGRNCTNC